MSNLRDRCLSHFATLDIPLRPEALDAALSNAEKDGLSHLSFLDELIGPQLPPVTSARWNVVSGRRTSPRPKPWKASTGSSIPRLSTGCRSKSWPPAISSGAAVLLGKAAGKPSEAAIRPTEIGVRASGFMLLMAVVFLLHLINGARAECLYTMGMDFDAVRDHEAASRAYRQGLKLDAGMAGCVMAWRWRCIVRIAFPKPWTKPHWRPGRTRTRIWRCLIRARILQRRGDRRSAPHLPACPAARSNAPLGRDRHQTYR